MKKREFTLTLFTKEMSKAEFEKMMNMVVKITEDLIDDYEWNHVA